ncbi:MAG: Dihydrolipoyllysine-residue acetyltransferase component of pyruvate dehydrogenase complex [Chlamydiae bacterium]|nr:Dihydrolipoyllysine-residue acetyltransferase component of pyruvate dehydrogenase complex [Chlamydiota bacterium]
MPFTLTMPKLSPTMEEGTIAKWHASEGDFVNAGDVLMEVATDKATVEHDALDEGYLRKILVTEGSEAIVNQPIAIFTETADETIEGYEPEGALVVTAAPAEEASEEEKAAPTTQAALPPTTGAGMSQPAFVPEPPLESYTFEKPTSAVGGRIPASPLARRLASEKGVDLSTIRGSGPGGRVVSEDLDSGQPAAIVAFGRQEEPTEMPGTFEEESLTPMRKAIGRRLQESKTFIPHFYVTQEIDAEPMVRIREELKKQGVRVTFNDFIMRATALTLRQHPEVNSGFDSVNNAIIRFKTIDISLAVSMEEGLVTPIVRHADYKNLGQISSEVRALAKRARAGKLSREEYAGGSFTISNLGMFGVRDFVAVINPPQAAILAIGGIQEKAVVKEGQVAAGKVLSVTLSADHRVVDGAASARFLVTLQGLLESPSALLI